MPGYPIDGKSNSLLKMGEEHRLATLLSYVPGMAYRRQNDRAWTLELVSEGCEILTGYPAAALTAAAGTYGSLIHPDDRERVWSGLQEQLSQESGFRLTYRIVTADGTVKCALDHGRAVIDPGGVQILEGFVTDVTDCLGAEHKLQAQKERFQRVIEHSDAGYFRLGVDGRFQDVNPAWLRMYGFGSKEEVVGQHYSRFQVAEDAGKADDVVSSLFGGEALRGEFTRLRRDGTVGYHTFSANPVWEGGRIAAIEGFLADTTDSKLAGQQKRASEQRYRSLFDSMHEGVALHRLIESDGVPVNYILQDVNERYEQIVGLRREQVVGKLATEIYATDEAPYLEKYAAVVKSGSAIRFEAYYPPMDRHFVISAAPAGDKCFSTIFFDVTEQKRAEERYRLISENSADVIWVWDLRKNRLVYISPSVEQVRGFTPEQVMAQSMEEGLPPATYRRLIPILRAKQAEIEAGNESARYWRTEVDFVCADGTTVDTETSIKLVSGGDGRVSQIIGISRDIRERKRATGELERVSRMMSMALLAGKSGAWELDLRTGKLHWTEEYFQLLRQDPLVEPTLEKFYALIHPEDRPLIEHSIQAANPTFALQFRVLLPDGVHWMERRGEVIRDQAGVPVKMIGITSDVTHQRQIEEKMRQLVTAIEHAEEQIVVTDRQGKIQYCNPAFERVTGYSHAEVEGQNPRILRSGKHPPEFYRELWATLLRGEVWRGRLINRKKDGTFYDEDATISPILDASKRITGFVAIKRDVSERVHLERQLLQAQKLESIGRLAGGVAHDFNNLLTVINGYADFLLAELDPESELRSDAEEIRRAGERAAGLTKQLLAFSRKQIVEPKIVDVNAILRDSRRMLQRLIGEDVRLLTSEHPSLGRIKADPEQIYQVLMNLVVNARDAMPDGGTVNLETANVRFDQAQAAHPDSRPGPYVRITVTDDGIGMDERTRQRVFEPFFTTKDRDRGTGLGLSTVYGIVRQSGGWTEVKSEPGAGTCFALYFPEVEVVPDDGAAALSSVSASSEGTVLLVEDQDSVRRFSRSTLERHGYRVLEAANADEALDVVLAFRGEIHLLLTDVVLPGLNGKRLSERLRELRPKMKVLFMSGYTDEVLGHRGVLEPGVAYIPKPFSPDKLADKIAQVLSGVDTFPQSPE